MPGVMFALSFMEDVTPEDVVKENSQPEEQLWEILAPKMLKKFGDDLYDGNSLLDRCVPDKKYELDSGQVDIGF